MAVPTAAEVRAYVGAAASDDAAIEKLVAVSEVLVDNYVADAVEAEADIPETVMDRAYLLVAAELWGIDQAPNGVLNQQFESDDAIQSVPARVSADALRPIYPLLGQWVMPVIA